MPTIDEERRREEEAKKEAQRVAKVTADLPRGAIPVEADHTTHQKETAEDRDTSRNRGALDKTSSDKPAPDLKKVAEENPGVRPNPRKVPKVDEKHRTSSTTPSGKWPE